MKIVGSLLIVLLSGISAFAQDCNPCIGVNKIQVISPTDANDTLAQLNSGTQVGLYLKMDNATIVGIAEDYTRLLEFTDNNKTNLLRKGKVIERSLEEFTIVKGEDVETWVNGFNYGHMQISDDGHSLLIDIESMARPSSTAQGLYLEGQLGIYVTSDINEEVLVKNVKLSKDSTTVVNVNGEDITFSYVRTDASEGGENHIFSYDTRLPVIGLSESAVRTQSEGLSNNEVGVSGFENLQLMLELPKSELQEIPFRLNFGLGL